MLATALRQGESKAVELAAAFFAIAAVGLLGCPPGRDADVNRDGVVDAADVALVTSCLGADLAATPACASADTDADRDVDAGDLAFVTDRSQPAAFPALTAVEPAAGAVGVPRTAWLVLDFAGAFRGRSLETLALVCDGVARRFTPLRLSATRLLVNPRPDLPGGAACSLSWLGPAGAELLAFATASAGDPATVYYDRTDTTSPPPFPDDYWLVPDASTATGQRVAVAVPDRESDVVQLFTSLIHDTAVLDGFSPLAMIVAELSAAPDPASLPMTAAASLDPLASVGLFDLTPGGDQYGERVPFQLHVRNDDVGDQPTAHTLVAFPSIPLTPGGRYGFVVTRRALANPARPFDASPFLSAVLGPAQPGEDPAVGAVRAIARDVIDGLVAASPPIPADDVALALRISVRSTDAIPRDLLAMKAQVLAEPPPEVTITAVSQGSSGPATVRGTWRAPDWRVGGLYLARDASGVPRITRRVSVPFVLALPAAARTRPVPVVMYQHGNPSNAEEVLSDSTLDLRNAGFAIAGFTDPLNRQYIDAGQQLTNIFGALLFGGRLPDIWMQTYGEQVAFLRALETLAARDFLPRNAPDGVRELDLSRPLAYKGSSYGANHGQAFLAYAPEIRAASLVAGGSRLAEVLFRQDQTDPLEIGGVLDLVSGQVPNVRAPDVWAGLSLFQMIFDPQDPQNHAAFLHRNPIEVAGTTRKASLLVVEGIGDSFTPNNATRSLAWTAGPLPLLSPIREPVPYLASATGMVRGNLDADTTGAFVQTACANPTQESHYCAQAPSRQESSFFVSALGAGAPTILSFDADSDADGLADVDESFYGADPANPDSDGDGLLDGVEVSAGMNPSDATDADQDRDGDGLSNATEIALGTGVGSRDTDADGLDDGAEVTRGTDPLRHDTDGGGRTDGQEVNLDHTDPLDPQDDIPLVDLPVVLIDGAGYRWPINERGHVQRGTSDAFSQYGMSSNYPGGGGSFHTAATEDHGREIVHGPRTEQGLRVRRKIYVPTDAGFARFLEIIENTTEEPIALTIYIGPGFSNSQGVVATSSGDATLDSVDEWAVVDDRGTNFRPAVAHVFAGVGARTEPVPAEIGTDRYGSVGFPITVVPHEPVIVMHFAAQNGSSTEATAIAGQLHGLGLGALAGLSSAERKAIVTFDVAPDADGDGVLDFDEIALGTDFENPDSDGDGLLDGFEVDHGFDPLVAGDAPLDADGDGADNLAEQTAGTDPLDPDSDEDGLDDGAELALGTDPKRRDTDRDGLSDFLEVSLGTDPLDALADADGDGLLDAEEVQLGTNPLDVDTDGDGLRDDFELASSLDPRDPTDAAADWDEDGLTTLEEFALGTDIWEFDTDRDELGDGDEIAHGVDPLRRDTDGGGRSDGREVRRDHTDPASAADDHLVVSLPVDVFSRDGIRWTINADGSIGGTGFARRLYAVHDFAIELVDEGTVSPDGGSFIVSWYGWWLLYSSREIHVAQDGAFLRVLDSTDNRRDQPEHFYLELDGSGPMPEPAPAFLATSSGDALLGTDDDWFVADDADGTGDPALAQVFAGRGAELRPWSVSGDGEQSSVRFDPTIQPGEVVSFAMFLAQASTRDAALDMAERLADLEGGALDGLSEAERAAIVNFAIPPPAPGTLQVR